MTTRRGRPLGEREKDAILAGLRLLMAWNSGDVVSRDPILDDEQIGDIASNMDKWPKPDNEFIDNLVCDLESRITLRLDEGLLERMARVSIHSQESPVKVRAKRKRD